jgi:hypothetical protein
VIDEKPWSRVPLLHIAKMKFVLVIKDNKESGLFPRQQGYVVFAFSLEMAPKVRSYCSIDSRKVSNMAFA